jgi:hypothetical protein
MLAAHLPLQTLPPNNQTHVVIPAKAGIPKSTPSFPRKRIPSQYTINTFLYNIFPNIAQYLFVALACEKLY